MKHSRHFLSSALLLFVPLFTIFGQGSNTTEDFEYQYILDDVVLKNDPTLYALIVSFKESNIENFKKTIENNPQILAIHLSNPNQEAVDCLSKVLGKTLTYLEIDYCGDSLTLSNYHSVEELTIFSRKLKFLDMSKSSLDSLDILSIEAENLRSWKTKSEYLKLGLIDLIAPNLNHFPIQSIPMIYQFTMSCSLNEFPSFLCSSEYITLMSFENYKVIEIDPCFEQLIYNGFYSNLTILDGVDGPVKLEYLSEDRQ